MAFSLVSITYGAIHCNILAMQIKYDNHFKLHTVQFICIMFWRCLEITSRVVTLVLFIASLKLRSMPFLLVTFSISLLAPWVEFWINGSHFPTQTKVDFKPMGRELTLIVITLLHAAIDFFCWSGVKLQLSSEELVDKTHKGSNKTFHYSIRLVENVMMILVFKFTDGKSLLNCCDSLIATQVIITYLLAIGFMLLFYQYLQPGWSGNSLPDQTEETNLNQSNVASTKETSQ